MSFATTDSPLRRALLTREEDISRPGEFSFTENPQRGYISVDRELFYIMCSAFRVEMDKFGKNKYKMTHLRKNKIFIGLLKKSLELAWRGKKLGINAKKILDMVLYKIEEQDSEFTLRHRKMAQKYKKSALKLLV